MCMGPIWGPLGSCRPQMGPMLAPWTLLSGSVSEKSQIYHGDPATWLHMLYHRRLSYGPLTRYAKLRVAQAPGMPGTFSPRYRLQRKLLVSDPGMHHVTCVTHVPWCMSGSQTRDGGENVPGIPGVCATRNCAYLVRGPLRCFITMRTYELIHITQCWNGKPRTTWDPHYQTISFW